MPPVHGTDKRGRSRRNKHAQAVASHARLIFALVIVAVFLDVMDFSVVNVALPTIMAQFGASLASIQWVIGAYGLTMAGLLMLSGRAGDIYGQKKLFVAGVALFTLTSLASGLATSLLMLVAFRAIQGIGAAVSSVTAFSIFIIIFPEGKERNKAMGVFMAVLSAGFAAGAMAGGFLTAFLGWRYVFFVNVPIGTATAFLINKFLPESEGRSARGRLDLPGAVTITAGLMLLVYSLTAASSGNILSAQVLLPLALAVASLAAFLHIESRSAAPLVPLSFLRRGVVLNANAAALIIASASGGIGVLVTVFMQQVLGYSSLLAGLGFLPPALIFFIIGGWFIDPIIGKFGIRRVLIVSTAFISAGIALMIPLSAKGGYLSILPGTLLWALGASIGFPALSIAALSGIKPGEEGLASGLITTSQRIGFPLGLSVLVAISAAAAPVSASANAVSVSVLGFRWAFAAASILSLIAIFLTLRIKIVGHHAHMEGISAEFSEEALP